MPDVGSFFLLWTHYAQARLWLQKPKPKKKSADYSIDKLWILLLQCRLGWKLAFPGNPLSMGKMTRSNEGCFENRPEKHKKAFQKHEKGSWRKKIKGLYAKSG